MTAPDDSQAPPGPAIPQNPDPEGAAYLEWLRGQPCVILGKRSGQWAKLPDGAWVVVWVQACHVRVRKWGHLDNAVPLDHRLHHEQHQHGIETFQAKYQVDLAALAREHTERWRRERREYAW